MAGDASVPPGCRPPGGVPLIRRPAARFPRSGAVGLLGFVMVACAVPATSESPFTLDLIGAASVASFDSLPEPRIEVTEGRVRIHAHFGLGATGYRLLPFGTIEEGVVDLLVTAELPGDTMGLTVLTDYYYVVTTAVLDPGTWRVRVHQAIAEEGNPELLLEQEVVVVRR